MTLGNRDYQKQRTVRIDIPLDQFPAYEGQWIEVVQLVLSDDSLAPYFRAVRRSKLFDDDERLRRCLSKLVADWNLEGDSGPLPKPRDNPEAFTALADSDMELFLWVGQQVLDLIPIIDHQDTRTDEKISGKENRSWPTFRRA